MPDKIDPDTVCHTVQQFVVLQAKLRQLAAEREPVPPELCPLRDDHLHLSQAIWGTGCWGWKCGFCQKEFEE